MLRRKQSDRSYCQCYKKTGTFINNSILDGDSTTSALGVADNNFESYYQINDWDDAVAYHTGNEGWGLTVELDQAYRMDRFAIAAPDDSTYYTNAAVYYWDNGVKKKASGLSLQRKTDVNGRAYYEITLADPIVAQKVQFGLQVSYYGTHRIQGGGVAAFRNMILWQMISGLCIQMICIFL